MTVRRVFFFLCWSVLLLFCLATGDKFLYFALAVMTGMLLLSGLSLLLARLRFRVEERVEPWEAEAGGPGDVSITLSNPYIFPFPQLEAEYLLPGPAGGTVYAASFTVLPLQRIRIHETPELPCRGVYPVGLRSVTLYDMFGLFRMKLPFEKLTKAPMPQITVLPRLRPVSQVTLPVLESPVNSAGAARATEDTSSPADSRGYRPGDPVKRIHWKLSARQGSLMVKTYEPEAVADALIYLDTQDPGLPAQDAWYAGDAMMSTAVSLTGAILAAGVPVRVIYLKDRRVEHRLTAPAELTALRHALAALDLSGGRSLRRLLAREGAALTGARCAYVLTAALTETSADMISTLSRAGTDLTVGLCCTGEAPDENSAALMRSLERQEITVSVLPYGDDPAARLAAKP